MFYPSATFKCQQNLGGKTIDKNAEILLSFNTTLSKANQYFSARIKTDEKYDYSNNVLLDFELTSFDPI